MNLLFKNNIKRLDLLKIKSKESNSKIRISIFRNHSFESVASVLNAFLDLSDMTAEYIYSDYDDSLNFDIKESDLNIIWLDVERYKNINLEDFLTERLTFLRQNTKAPILLIYTGKKITPHIESIPDCYNIHTNEVTEELGDEAYDLEKEAYSGTRLSNKSAILIAQKLGLQILPAIFKQQLKALVFDLDNTLYAGILGEDGIRGIKLTNEHKKLQNYIKELKNKGFFICIASKNEEDDAIELFKQRADFPLRWEDFTAAKVNWQDKSKNLQELAKIMNIGLDSIVFIDDNPAEIQNIEFSGLPVKTILAENPEALLQILSIYPGLLKLKKTSEDNIRSKDIKANAERIALAKKLSVAEYFSKLGIELCFTINDCTQVPRIAELFNKTNQFILNYKRYSESEVKTIMNEYKSVIITVKMSDILSDSGIIALLSAHNDAGSLIVDEITVSCRALGRNLENIMLPKLIQLAKNHLKANNSAQIKYKKGPRNQPAISWIENLSGAKAESEGTVQYKIPEIIKTEGIKIEIKDASTIKV